MHAMRYRHMLYSSYSFLQVCLDAGTYGSASQGTAYAMHGHAGLSDRQADC